ncbi:toll/interleukin-1 receptor domain-containing protein [Novosphingobium sp. 1949]|uniref:Toll/interleukin-1 receptor domain-containing protein n=1 Tax=Novosphingobium organovorum TaxID=2930092 RepID=A0ABT0BJ57_9SPHN|nr:toll/interleukin-1 receptor domain-containing protein [Novosphingobium organovorum]MCJ2184754.1 toll/interleukin-1 receptor domain-containing protein [Novosphingobium organovorum]
MLPTVFLSLSGVDVNFVANVERNIPPGMAYFYPKSFENGENLISAMEERVAESSIFVLFASRASVDSVWVQFEIERARLNKIQNPRFRYLVFPVEPGVDREKLPDWMREGWVPSAGHTSKDIARYVRGVLASMAEQNGTVLPPHGRGGLIDKARREYQNATFTNKVAPSVFLFSGHAGIGRRTVKRLLIPVLFPARPEMDYGPEFELPAHADLGDIYRAVRQEMEEHFSLQKFESAWAAFNDSSTDEQVDEVLRSMCHFADLGQAVTIVIGFGLYEDRGELKPWAATLLSAAARYDQLKICLISGRQLKFKDLRPLQNVQQVNVEHLEAPDIRTLILETIPIFGGTPALPNDTVIQSIGGHPTVARSVARLIAYSGPMVVDGDPKQLHDIQEEILAESLSFDRLKPIECDILSILSWVPQLNGQMMSEIICNHHGVDQKAMVETIEFLIAGCLMQISGANYLISAPIRGMFRRKHGYGSTELRAIFARFLKAEWESAVKNDELKAELFDAFVYMTALEGGTLPKEFKGLLLPSTLQDLVRDAYDRRHIDDHALDRVVAWGMPAIDMKMDENTREEILSYLLRALVRLGSSDANDVLDLIKDRGFRSAAYLEAFLIRLTGGNLNDAVLLLRDARRIGKYMNSVIADLAICLKLLGRWADLDTLLQEEVRRVDRNPVLLDIRIGILVAAGEFPEAEREIGRLRAMPFDDGRADSRTATILMNRDHDFEGAYQLLTAVLNRQTRGALGVRRLRALAAARGKRYEEARRDATYLRTRPGGEDTYQRIEAEIALAQKNYDGAEVARRKVRAETVQDRLLGARILEARGLDIQTPLDQRQVLLTEAAAIRQANRSVDEYDFD